MLVIKVLNAEEVQMIFYNGGEKICKTQAKKIYLNTNNDSVLQVTGKQMQLLLKC